MAIKFKDKKEFKTVMDKLFSLMARDPEVGPKLRAAKAPQRFVFTDMGLTLSIKGSDEKAVKQGQHLQWIWDDQTWDVLVILKMRSDVANKYFQGKQNVPLAIITNDIRITGGHFAKTLELVPLTKPIFKKYIKMLQEEGYSHLVA